MAVGYIYVLSNSAMGKLLKIGFTCGSVEKRAAELSGATNVPSAFIVEYFHISEDVEEIERLAHAELNERRYNENREFFDTSVADAIAVIQRLVRQPEVRFQREPKNNVDATFACRRCGFLYTRSAAKQYCPKCGF